MNWSFSLYSEAGQGGEGRLLGSLPARRAVERLDDGPRLDGLKAASERKKGMINGVFDMKGRQCNNEDSP